jgi:hypothetical protein
MIRRPITALLLASMFVLGGCIAARVTPSRSICLLIDANAASADNPERQAFNTGINSLLRVMEAGDFLAMAAVNATSDSSDARILQATLDSHPFMANAQKRTIRRQIDEWLQGDRSTSGANLPSALMLAVTKLHQRPAVHNTIVLVSVLETIPSRIDLEALPLQLNGITVLAITGEPAASDDAYRQRVERWRYKVESAGGQWKDLANLAQLATWL